jgi:hypothetical protein
MQYAFALCFLCNFYFLSSWYGVSEDPYLSVSKHHCGHIDVEKQQKIHKNKNFPIYWRARIDVGNEAIVPNQNKSSLQDSEHKVAWYAIKDVKNNKRLGDFVRGEQDCSLRAETPIPPAKRVYAFYVGADTAAFKNLMTDVQRSLTPDVSAIINIVSPISVESVIFEKEVQASVFYKKLRTVRKDDYVIVVLDGIIKENKKLLASFKRPAIANEDIEDILLEERNVRHILFVDMENKEPEVLLGGSNFYFDEDFLNQARYMYIQAKPDSNQNIESIFGKINGDDWSEIGQSLEALGDGVSYRLGRFE